MPHSSQRKKPPSPYDNKLVNVTLDDGWSTVSRKANADHVSREQWNGHHNEAEASGHRRKPLSGPPQKLIERLTHDQIQALAVHLPHEYQGIDRFIAAPLQADLSEARIKKGYQDKAGKWRASQDAKDVEDILYKRIGPERLSNITKAVCLGSGSFSFSQQAISSQWQIAAFIAVVKMLSNMKGQDQEIKLYVQDPAYNTIDRILLNYLGIEILETPAAFALCDESAFVFAPHVQLTLWARDMRQGQTALILGNDVDKLINNLATESDLHEYFRSVMHDHESMHVPDTSIKEDFKQFVMCQEQGVWPSTISEAHAAFHDLKFYWKAGLDKKHYDSIDPVSKALGDVPFGSAPGTAPGI